MCLHCIIVHYNITIYHVKLYDSILNYVTLLYITLHYITLHCIILLYITSLQNPLYNQITLVVLCRSVVVDDSLHHIVKAGWEGGNCAMCCSFEPICKQFRRILMLIVSIFFVDDEFPTISQFTDLVKNFSSKVHIYKEQKLKWHYLEAIHIFSWLNYINLWNFPFIV